MSSEIGQNRTVRPPRLSRAEKREQERRGKQENAARLVAEDDLPDEKIAEAVGIARSTLSEWKLLPEFKVRVAEHVAEITHQIMHSGYCRIDKRLTLLNKNVNRLEAIIGAKREQVESILDEVGDDLLGADKEIEGELLGDFLAKKKKKLPYQMVELALQPGADQGLHFRKETPVKHGVQIEYVVGISLLVEERMQLKHIAQETGEWIERIGGNISLDSALAGLLGKVGPSEEEASSGDSSDVADQAPEGV